VILCGSPGKGNVVNGIWIFADLAAFWTIFFGGGVGVRILTAAWSNSVLSFFDHFFSAQDLLEFAGFGSTLLFAAVFQRGTSRIELELCGSGP